jgi:hypothetical protein
MRRLTILTTAGHFILAGLYSWEEAIGMADGMADIPTAAFMAEAAFVVEDTEEAEAGIGNKNSCS